MGLKSRFILVAFGIITFFIIAPTIVFFARGYYFDFENFRVIKTGILTIKTDPRGAEVYLQEKLSGTTPTGIRFLFPGEYEVALKKEGFEIWKKRIRIHGQRVTSLPQTPREKIFLFSETKIQTTVSTTTKDLFASDDSIFFLEKNSIYKLDPENISKSLIATTTKPVISPEEIGQEQIAYPETWPDLKKITDGQDYSHWMSDEKTLVYGNRHEVWLYQPEQMNESALITRSTKLLGPAAYNDRINYVFVSEDNQIKAIEADHSGQPNVYPLIETKNRNIKLASNPEGTHLIYLDGGNLYALKMR